MFLFQLGDAFSPPEIADNFLWMRWAVGGLILLCGFLLKLARDSYEKRLTEKNQEIAAIRIVVNEQQKQLEIKDEKLIAELKNILQLGFRVIDYSENKE